ncbi:hypothetical protein PR048_022382 [Dryococelus australis]|uniref:Uncharacterized protein n=1 Tax=Dryococelus australis TaxID=614101 RepID=A0ABQ9H0V5_9NEOP|nr:hypothetical protein PR048_022382 [Dryococelus australis]
MRRKTNQGDTRLVRAETCQATLPTRSNCSSRQYGFVEGNILGLVSRSASLISAPPLVTGTAARNVLHIAAHTQWMTKHSQLCHNEVELVYAGRLGLATNYRRATNVILRKYACTSVVYAMHGTIPEGVIFFSKVWINTQAKRGGSRQAALEQVQQRANAHAESTEMGWGGGGGGGDSQLVKSSPTRQLSATRRAVQPACALEWLGWRALAPPYYLACKHQAGLQSYTHSQNILLCVSTPKKMTNIKEAATSYFRVFWKNYRLLNHCRLRLRSGALQRSKTQRREKCNTSNTLECKLTTTVQVACGEVLLDKLVLVHGCTFSVHAAGTNDHCGASGNWLYINHSERTGTGPIIHVLRRHLPNYVSVMEIEFHSCTPLLPGEIYVQGRRWSRAVQIDNAGGGGGEWILQLAHWTPPASRAPITRLRADLSLRGSGLLHALSPLFRFTNYRQTPGQICETQVLYSSPIHRDKNISPIHFGDVKHIYSEVAFAIGSQFIIPALHASEPIADLRGNTLRMPDVGQTWLDYYNPCRVVPGISHVGMVPDDAAGRRVFSRLSPVSPPLHSGAAQYSPRFTPIGSRNLDEAIGVKVVRSPSTNIDRFQRLNISAHKSACRHSADEFPKTNCRDLHTSDVAFNPGKPNLRNVCRGHKIHTRKYSDDEAVCLLPHDVFLLSLSFPLEARKERNHVIDDRYLCEGSEIRLLWYFSRAFRIARRVPATCDDKAAQPATCDDKAAQPATCDDKAAQPATCDDKAAQPATCDDKAAQPETCDDKAAQPETCDDKAAQPATCDDKAAQPETCDDKAAQPATCDDKAAQPATCDDKAAQPATCDDKAAQPTTCDDKAAQPATCDDKAAQPATCDDKAAQPATCDDKAAQHELLELKRANTLFNKFQPSYGKCAGKNCPELFAMHHEGKRGGHLQMTCMRVLRVLPLLQTIAFRHIRIEYIPSFQLMLRAPPTSSFLTRLRQGSKREIRATLTRAPSATSPLRARRRTGLQCLRRGVCNYATLNGDPVVLLGNLKQSSVRDPIKVSHVFDQHTMKYSRVKETRPPVAQSVGAPPIWSAESSGFKSRPHRSLRAPRHFDRHGSRHLQDSINFPEAPWNSSTSYVCVNHHLRNPAYRKEMRSHGASEAVKSKIPHIAISAICDVNNVRYLRYTAIDFQHTLGSDISHRYTDMISTFGNIEKWMSHNQLDRLTLDSKKCDDIANRLYLPTCAPEAEVHDAVDRLARNMSSFWTWRERRRQAGSPERETHGGGGGEACVNFAEPSPRVLRRPRQPCSAQSHGMARYKGLLYYDMKTTRYLYCTALQGIGKKRIPKKFQYVLLSFLRKHVIGLELHEAEEYSGSRTLARLHVCSAKCEPRRYTAPTARTALSADTSWPMRVKRSENRAAPKCKGGETGDPRENLQTSGIMHPPHQHIIQHWSFKHTQFHIFDLYFGLSPSNVFAQAFLKGPATKRYYSDKWRIKSAKLSKVFSKQTISGAAKGDTSTTAAREWHPTQLVKKKKGGQGREVGGKVAGSGATAERTPPSSGGNNAPTLDEGGRAIGVAIARVSHDSLALFRLHYHVENNLNVSRCPTAGNILNAIQYHFYKHLKLTPRHFTLHKIPSKLVVRARLYISQHASGPAVFDFEWLNGRLAGFRAIEDEQRETTSGRGDCDCSSPPVLRTAGSQFHDHCDWFSWESSKGVGVGGGEEALNVYALSRAHPGVTMEAYRLAGRKYDHCRRIFGSRLLAGASCQIVRPIVWSPLSSGAVVSLSAPSRRVVFTHGAPSEGSLLLPRRHNTSSYRFFFLASGAVCRPIDSNTDIDTRRGHDGRKRHAHQLFHRLYAKSTELAYSLAGDNAPLRDFQRRLYHLNDVIIKIQHATIALIIRRVFKLRNSRDCGDLRISWLRTLATGTQQRNFIWKSLHEGKATGKGENEGKMRTSGKAWGISRPRGFGEGRGGGDCTGDADADFHRSLGHNIRVEHDPGTTSQCREERLESYDGNTARPACRSDVALGVRISVARIAPSVLDLGRAAK